MLLATIAFVAGVLSAFSPCIAPILPLYVLRGVSVVKLATGVAVATAFTMIASAYLLTQLGSVGRWIGVAVMASSGLLLILDRGDWLTSRWAGFGLGLAWAPCVGPVAAGILALGGLASVGYTALYSLGLGFGVALCALTTKRLRHRLSHPRWRQAIGLVLVLTAAVFASGSAGGPLQRAISASPSLQGPLWRWEERFFQRRLPVRVAPGWQGQWFGKPAPSLRGSRTLVVFWSYTCEACTQSMPKVVALAREHHLQIVTVHSPQYAWATDRGEIAAAAVRYGIAGYPLLLDDRRQTWKRWGATRWPWHAYVDEQGRVIAARSGTNLEQIASSVDEGAAHNEGDFSLGEGRQWERRGVWREENGVLIAGKDAALRLRGTGSFWFEANRRRSIASDGVSLKILVATWYPSEGWISAQPGVRVSAWRIGS
jgi:cytochrome c-type biogenesis protein